MADRGALVVQENVFLAMPNIQGRVSSSSDGSEEIGRFVRGLVRRIRYASRAGRVFRDCPLDARR